MDIETTEVIKILPDYQNLPVDKKINILNMLIEWAEKELEKCQTK